MRCVWNTIPAALPSPIGTLPIRVPCGKWRHASRELAIAELIFLVTKSPRRRDRAMETYYCEPCEAWHVGHADKRHFVR